MCQRDSHQAVDSIGAAGVQEDAEAGRLSILSGAHLDYCSRLVDRLRAQGADDVLLLVGGTNPHADRPALEALGYKVFATGTHPSEVVAFVKAALR